METSARRINDYLDEVRFSQSYVPERREIAGRFDRSDASGDGGLARWRAAGMDLRLWLADLGSRILLRRDRAGFAARLPSQLLPVLLRLPRNAGAARSCPRARPRRVLPRDGVSLVVRFACGGNRSRLVARDERPPGLRHEVPASPDRARYAQGPRLHCAAQLSGLCWPALARRGCVPDPRCGRPPR